METQLLTQCTYLAFIVWKTLCLSGVTSSSPVQVNISSNDPTDQGLPNDINVSFTTGTNSTTEFRLIRVDYDNLPIYSIETDQEGQKIIKENVSKNENVAFYQDNKKGAVFQLARVNEAKKELDDFIITRGQYRQGNATYSIQPTLRSKREASQNESQSDQRYEIKQLSAPPITMSDHINPPPEQHSSLPSNMESEFPGRSKFKRPRRQTFSTYYIDVTVFLDSSCYNRFLRAAFYDSAESLTKIREYYAFIFTGSTTQFPLSYLRRCYTTYPYTCFSTSYVDTSAVLSNFAEFLNSTAGNDLVFPYDHAMLFSSADLWTASGDILGLAWIKTICRTDGMSSSVIEDTGDYSAIFTAAHELGHSLSSEHDGTNNTCTLYDRYLMAPSDSDPTSSTKLNPWRFSSCTVKYFTTYLTELTDTSSGQMCLSNTLEVIGVFPDVSQRLLGQEIPSKKQCQLRYGSMSDVCEGEGFPEICASLYCYNPSSFDSCNGQPALSGTTCGCGKVCNQGKCTTDTTDPLYPECALVDNWPNCTTEYCYDSVLKYNCQRTCADFVITTTIKECFDDPTFTLHGLTCKTIDLSYCTSSSIQQSCCRKCRQGVTTVKAFPTEISTHQTCQDDPDFSFHGLDCYSLMLGSINYCYFSKVNESCCASCAKRATQIPGCEFGNRDSILCSSISSCRRLSHDCCQTCVSGGVSPRGIRLLVWSLATLVLVYLFVLE